MDKEDLKPLYYAPYGVSAWQELQRHGVRPRKHRCNAQPSRMRGWLAVHRSQLVRYKECFRLGDRQPTYIVGHHIYVFKVGPRTLSNKRP